jgi:Fuc2NAc and GlcNAc transferase
MPVLYLTLYLAFIFIFSVIVTGLVRRYSLHKSLIDIPNERSSHVQPTPRGGGLSIVLSFLISLVLMYSIEWIALDLLLALGGGGLIVAVVGWLDDHRHIQPLIRGLIYTIAAIWTIYFLGGLYSVKAGESFIALPLLGNILAVLGLVWITNLYNFMDGTDALAATQSICKDS